VDPLVDVQFGTIGSAVPPFLRYRTLPVKAAGRSVHHDRNRGWGMAQAS
jgi:hypothetical protein